MRSDTVIDLTSIKTINLFLARLFLREADQELINQLSSDEMLPILKSVGVCLPEDSVSDDELIEALSVEYTSLFIAPGSMPPYQSVAESGRYLSEASDRVELFYQKCGYDYRKEYPNLFPDHIGIELSFIASLIEAEIKAIKENDIQRVTDLRFSRKEFFEKHLGSWYLSYFDQLQSGIKHPFYQAVVEFARAFLDEEAENMTSVLQN